MCEMTIYCSKPIKVEEPTDVLVGNANFAKMLTSRAVELEFTSGKKMILNE